MHSNGIAWRVGDVAQSVGTVMIHGVRHVNESDHVAGGLHDGGKVPTHVELVARHDHHAEVLGVHTTDRADRG